MSCMVRVSAAARSVVRETLVASEAARSAARTTLLAVAVSSEVVRAAFS